MAIVPLTPDQSALPTLCITYPHATITVKRTHPMKMKYCNDTHKQAVVAYSGQECPLCLMQHRLIEMADAREDVDQQAIQELTNEVDALTKRVKQLEAYIVRHKENENVPLEVRQRVFSWI
jgi:hypothetical protein